MRLAYILFALVLLGCGDDDFGGVPDSSASVDLAVPVDNDAGSVDLAHD